MDKGRQRTLVFCTAYTHGSAGQHYTWNQRYRIWVDAIRASTLSYDQILLIDDGSMTTPDWPDLTVVREGDNIRTERPFVLYQFREHLGRRAVSDFPGWVRSFFFAARFAQSNGFEKIIHIEADGFLISRRIQEYVNNIHVGWISLFCPLFARPESGVQIIAGPSVADFAAFASQPLDALAGAVIETTLPFTHVEKSFVGDRYGEYLSYVPIEAEWCMQAVPNGQIPADVYYWWLARPPAVVESAKIPGRGPGLMHPGVWYIDLFRQIDAVLKPRRYFEIGTNTGESLRAFSCDAVCVDPHLVVETTALQGRRRTYLFQSTSDAFFADNDLPRVFPEGFDIAFLDGLHHAEVLLRDFINAEKYAGGRSVIILHDCLPVNERMTEREWRRDDAEDEATRYFWTGDVWKVVVVLKMYRPDLTVHYVDCGPTGLVVCTQTSRDSTVLRERYDEIVAQMNEWTLARYGLENLWNLFPLLNSRKLIEADQMVALFGSGWSRHPAETLTLD